MTYKSDVNVPLLATLGLAGGLALVVIIIAVQAWVGFLDSQVAAEQSRVAVVRPLVALRDQQTRKIDSSRFDEQGRLVAIPIDAAMKLLVARGGRMPTTRPATRPST